MDIEPNTPILPENYLSKNEEVKELQNRSLNLHLEFDEKISGRLSFHNFEHIFAAVKGAMILYDEAINGNDIFNLMKDLNDWNKNKKEEEQISFEEFADVLRLAFSFHDLGNIAEVINGKVVLRENGLYEADGAEERSIEIAKILLANHQQLQKYIDLICHIINETKFNFNEDGGESRPFAVFVRVVDQIMTNYLRRDYSEFIEGLQQEAIDERKKPLEENTIKDFPKTRLSQLLVGFNSEEIKQKLAKIMNPYIPKNNSVPQLV